MDKTELIQKLYEKGAIKLGSFTLKSEVTTPLQIDLRQIIAYPQLLQAVAQKLWEEVKQYSNTIDLLCGVPETTLPIATQLSNQTHKKVLLVRKGNKSYGKKWVEGTYHLGENCLLMEDAVTTGTSALATIKYIKSTGLYVPCVVALLEREHGGRAALNNIDCEFHSVFTQTEVLNALKELGIEK